MKKAILNIGVAISVALVASSCYEDKGNYDYHELDQVSISTEGLGIEDEYAVERGDYLTIAPDVYFNGVKNDENAPLDYCWTLYNTSTGTGVDYTIDTLSTERILNAPVNRPGSTYEVLLTVTNRNDKTQCYKTFSCKVIDNVPAGWMMLYEPANAPGKTDIGLVCNSFVTAKFTGEKKLWDLFGASNGGPAEGEPLNIYHCTMPLASHGMPYFTTTKGIYGVSQSTFEKVFSHEDMFDFGVPEMDIKYMSFGGAQNAVLVLINGNDVYQSATSFTGMPSGFSVPKQGEIGSLANWASPHAAYFDAVVYDQDNHRFVCAPKGVAYFSSFASQDATKVQFDVNNCDGMRFEMSDWGVNKYDCILFSKGSERYIAIANFVNTNIASPAIGLTLKNVSSSPEIQNACAFATNLLGEYCYYAAGNKIYNLAYNSGKDATVAWTAPSADEVVTCIRTQKIYMNTIQAIIIPNANSLIHIATWNEKTKEGKLYEYTIVPTSGVINVDGQKYEYTVPGKVKDMCWKFQMVR